MPDVLIVRLHDRVVGQLRRGEDPSKVRLAIAEDFDAGVIALTAGFTVIPGTESPIGALSNFVGGYLPEGSHRSVLAGRRGIDAGNLFDLLRGGRRCGTPIKPCRTTAVRPSRESSRKFWSAAHRVDGRSRTGPPDAKLQEPHWTVDRLTAGDVIGTSPWQDGKS